TCATADAGTVLADMTLPSDWLAAASSGAKAQAGTWADTSADATGTAAHFRIYASDGTTCKSKDLTLDSTSVVAATTVTITSCSITAANA
ncbi:MAG: hypothetical protein ACREJF_02835, partial [Candidatus Methylomirabilales bacterium]